MRILFITANRLGDAVLTSGLVAWLTEQYPGARLTIACGPVAAPVFLAVPGIEALHVMQKGPLAKHWRRLWLATWRRRWDLVVDLRASAIAWCLRARSRRIAGKAPDHLHRVEHLGAVFGLDPPPAPRLFIPAAAVTRAARLVPSGNPVLALGPAANWRGKQWPADRFARLAQDMTAEDGLFPGARVAVLAAEQERAQAAPVIGALPSERVIDLVGAVDPIEAAACLQRTSFFVGNDSGLMHVAAAAGIPTLGLFGPSQEAHYRPWGSNGAFVRTQRSYDDLVGGPGYDHRTTGTLMESLSVQAAMAAARDLKKRLDGDPARTCGVVSEDAQ